MYHDKKNRIILLVEDEAEVRTFIREYFEVNYQICEASNGVKGLEMAIRNNPDIIITDVIMPLMDGNEMCQKVKGGYQDQPYSRHYVNGTDLQWKTKLRVLKQVQTLILKSRFRWICLKYS